MNQEKRTWHAPELIDVGDVADVTAGMATNVRENSSTSDMTYCQPNRAPAEVELD